MGNDGSQDYSIVKSVITELKSKCAEAIKVIKSTVLPSTLNEMHKIDNNIIYNPEFLEKSMLTKIL